MTTAPPKLCVATSTRGLVQKVAYDWVQYGFRFFIQGTVAERFRDDPSEHDRRMRERFRTGISRYTRYRNQARGIASIRYIRHEDTWFALATPGERPESSVDEWKENDWKDITETPLRYWGHAVRYGYETKKQRWIVMVRIERQEYLGLKAFFEQKLWRRPEEELLAEFLRLPYIRSYGVKLQYRNIIDAINERRKPAGLPRVRYLILNELTFARVRAFGYVEGLHVPQRWAA